MSVACAFMCASASRRSHGPSSGPGNGMCPGPSLLPLDDVVECRDKPDDSIGVSRKASSRACSHSRDERNIIVVLGHASELLEGESKWALRRRALPPGKRVERLG